MPSQQQYSVQRYRKGWAIVYIDPTTAARRRYKLYQTDRPSAEAEARQRWALGDRTEWTAGALVERYIDAREADGIASTRRQRDAWKAMSSYWTNVSPNLIDEPMCKAYGKRRKVSPATLRYELTMLSAALRWAKAQKHIEDAPHIWRPASPEHVDRALTKEQFVKFFEQVKAPHAQLYMRLALATCARPTAILEITWDRVDFARGLITLNPVGRIQNAKRRPVVPIADSLMDALREAFAGRQSDAVIEHGGTPIVSIKKAFQAASKRSGLHASPYTLRHSGAIWKAEDGVSMDELAQLMGHSDSKTTSKHYARYSPTYLRTAANAGSW